MKTILFAAVLASLALAPNASAQLPPDAYQGTLWQRITAGFPCVGQHAVLPQFIRPGEPAGVYWYAKPGGDGVCIKGGSAGGPQF